MNLVAWWLMALMMLEFTLGLFFLFSGPGVPWFKRGVGALGSLGCLVIFLTLTFQLATGRAANLPTIEPKLLIFLFVFVNIFGFQIVAFLRRGGAPSGCLATMLKMAGCALIGWAAFALLVLACALMIFLAS